MPSFDLYLERAPDAPLDEGVLVHTLLARPQVHMAPDDPTRLVYHDEETGVHFSVLLHPDLLAAVEADARARAAQAGEHDEDEPSLEDAGRPPGARPGLLPDARDTALHEEDDEADDAADAAGEATSSDEETGEEPGDASSEPSPDIPLVVLALPWFRPGYFLDEALGLVEELRGAGDLSLVVPDDRTLLGEEEHEGSGETAPAGSGELDDPDPAALRARWEDLHRRVFQRLRTPGAISRWSPEQAEAFRNWGRARPTLAEQLAAEDIDVPRLQAARAPDGVHSLCVWDTRRSVMLPRCDLVLLVRPRERRGLLGRKTKIEETVVSGEELWRLLSHHAVYHDWPAPCLVFRRPDPLPRDLEEGLDTLPTRSRDEVRRTELEGVVDFDPAPEEGSTA